MWPEKKNQLYLAQTAICVIMTVPSQNRKIPPVKALKKYQNSYKSETFWGFFGWVLKLPFKILINHRCEMFTLEKRTALGPRTWGPSAKLTVSSANAWFKFFQFRGGRIAVDLWVFQDLHKGSRKDAEAASGNLVRPICCSSNILSSESIQRRWLFTIKPFLW